MRVALALALACGCTAPSGDCARADLALPPRAPAYALVASDYSSSAIGLLDTDGSVITAAWLDSGARPPGVVAALSGDVVLPTAPFAPCTVVLVDRFGTDVVSWLDPCGGEPVRGQLDVGRSLASNPHDVLRVGAAAWVTRYGVGLGAAADSIERGNDVVVVEGGRIARRIDLGALADDGETFARPDRMARIGPAGAEQVVVGLGRLSADFMRTGPGAVALVDPRTLEARLVPIAGLSGCGELDPIGEVVVVTCQGEAFGDAAARRARAGVVALGLDGAGGLVERAAFRAAEHPSLPVPTGPTIALAEDRWLTVAFGDIPAGTPDRALGIARGQAEVWLEAAPFTLGEGVYDAAHDLLLLPDAGASVIRRLRGDGTEREPIDATGCHGLPPREIARVAFP